VSNPLHKVLVVHTGGGIGDVLLSTAVVHALSEGGSRVDFLCQRSTAAALHGHPQIDQLWQWPAKGPGGILPWLSWARRLRRENYAAALVLWSTTATAWLTWMAGIPRRVGQDSRLSYSFLYTHKVRLRSEHGDRHSHWSDILLDWVRALGISPGPPQVRLTLDDVAQQRADRLLAGLPGEGPLLAVHPFKGPPVSLQRWPLEVFAAWIRALHDRLGARLIVTGSPNESRWAERIVEMAGVDRILNVAGKTDLATLACLARNCDAFICPDSGPMHVAAAAGARVLGIYALEEDFPQRWAPLSPRARVLRPQPTGCPVGCRKPTCPDFRCYRTVSPDQVVQEVKLLLQLPTS
jgi:ADP-heptose:LPS heptosyltransferase